ncbi:MAG TPA: TetR/AcrR family transcriptional regulator [Deltaproteobacteria bacterium]|nr:TetR/AcrR family transcriptional regulator [Deltaproteobacteria bacterium]HRW80808.1 TetR/AcrR family transcriptional regulator [Desulfomonilia bacterium]HNQ85575.1 TetR/AcrR family transcriptional regulator [Deltaproteobacteria bacterium]HNS89087.1 TetR/AcrR family transcriptional regulator [Deltaproteobacteria bacterium]HOY74310.1 TetR/AcrR family transcriptional regulator [Deltaproteobacteria bacterium]
MNQLFSSSSLPMDRNQRRDEIFHAALVAFARFGYQKTTMEDVAGALGMTKGNLYFYVSGKRDLYEKTVSSALQQWREAVAIAVARVDDVVEKFSVMARLSFDYLVDHEDLRAILIRDPGIFSLTPREDRFYEINAGAMQLIRNILGQGIAEGRFHPMDVDHAAELFFSIYIMFLIKRYVKSEGVSAARMYGEAMKIVLRGICTTQPQFTT